MTGSTFKYDIFLCHNDKDKPHIERIYRILDEEKKVKPFLDKKHLPPGHPWQEGIEDAIMEQVASCAVFVGPHGLGPVQKAEVQLALNRKFKEPTFPVIPVLLPGCEPKNKEHVPPFLSLQTWVDFRNGIGTPDSLEKLVNAIHGKSISEISISEIETAIQKASRGLLTWPTTLGENKWLSRKELDKIIDIVSHNSTPTLLLLGEPGSGKSALLAKLGQEMTSKGIPVLAIKADLLPVEINNFYELGNYLKLPFQPGECLVKLAEKGPVLLLLDQLDALADLVDLKSERLNVLLELINSLSGLPNIHIIASCREFEYSHDVRLKGLEVEKIRLDLPSWDAVIEILKYKKIEAANWPKSFRELLRVPQHLKLFLEFCQGPEEPQIFSSYHAMLDRLWEERVSPLSTEGSDLLDRMASLMAEREEFWLPTVLFQEDLALVDKLIAAGILVKEANGKRVGFCHQTMLDYAKARIWASGKERLADFIIKRQDALFVRPHLWAGLYYLREADPAIYQQEIERLWNFKELRFHLKILMIEFLGQLPDPTDFEEALLFPIIDDSRLRGKVFFSIKGSAGWFNRFETHLPYFMTQEAEKAKKIMPILQDAWDFAKEKVLTLISSYWAVNSQYDSLVLQVFYTLEKWDERSISIVCPILKRNNVNRFYVEQFLESAASSIPEYAPKILRAHLDYLLDEAKKKSPPKSPKIPEGMSETEKEILLLSYGPKKHFSQIFNSSTDWNRLSEIVESNPTAFLEYLWPWFVEVWEHISEEPKQNPLLTSYKNPYALELRLSGDFNSLHHGHLMLIVEKIVTLVAENDPERFIDFYQKYQESDLYIVHRLLSRGLAKIADKFPDFVMAYILADPRRLFLGNNEDSHLDSKQLITALAPHLSPDQLKKLVNYIRNWPMYDYEAIAESDLTIRFKRKKWEREHRLHLLKAIPVEYIDDQTKSFIKKEERAFPFFHEFDVSISEAQWIGSPVSLEQMAKASDENILKLFDKLDDGTGWDHPKRELAGGTIQASRILGDFAKKDPERVVGLIHELKPGKNEIAVGLALEGVADSIYLSENLFQLILELDGRNFKKEDFRLSVAHALRKRLEKERKALPKQLIALLSSWLSLGTKNLQPNYQEKGEEEKSPRIESVLWGFGGIEILPSGNFPVLEVIILSFLYADPSDFQSLLALLEKHLNRQEDPMVWASLLTYFRYFKSNNDDENEKFGKILDKLFHKYPSVRDSFQGALLIAYIQSWVKDQLVRKWLFEMRDGAWEKGPQVFGEILLLRHAWFPESKWAANEVSNILHGEYKKDAQLTKMRTGLAFCAAHLWPEPKFRDMATKILETLAHNPGEPIQKAIAKVFSVAGSLFPDEYTKRLLDLAIVSPEIIMASDEHFLFKHLTKLVGKELERVYKICSIFISEAGQDIGDISTRFPMVSEDLINISLRLQRNHDFRKKGLDLFEHLLELNAYHIKNVLDEIDRRPIS